MADSRVSQLVDLDSLSRFVNGAIPGGSGPLTVEKHTAGFSNETFYVNRGAERWVMRRPPAGPVLPTAHDVVREYRFLSALHGRARVPKPLALCEDTAVIGAPFYLMERKDGFVVRTTLPPAYDTPAGRRKMAEEMVDTLVEIHAVDWRAAGLAGRDSGYNERQVNRWASQWELTKPRTRELPGLDQCTAWLRANMPPHQAHTIVHGDYKIDNLMYDHAIPKAIAVFDWEMATIGDPLADLGYYLNTWAPPKPLRGFEDRPPIRAGIPQMEGFPTIQEIQARYEERSGRSMKDLLFYRALASYKGVVIIEGLYMHYIEGAAANPAAADFEWRVPMQIAALQQLIEDGE